MSGTSADAIDAVLVRFDPAPHIIASHTQALSASLRQRIRSVTAHTSLRTLAQLDVQLARLFAASVQNLLADTGLSAASVRAIGCHGQTVWHEPDSETPFSMQLGDPNLIAELTGILTVADFRRRDIAAGGQGAPLVPAFHQALFGSTTDLRCVLNLGGIANITVLQNERVFGFDTGPANTLMDAWSLQHRDLPFDACGVWAASGQPKSGLVEAMLNDEYFALPPPKSTGPERFSLHWLQNHLDKHRELRPQDIQASLLELTAQSVSQAIRQHASAASSLLVCGGGVHNQKLMDRLTELLHPLPVMSTAAEGIDPDFVEACAFAWLAQQRLLNHAGNIPAATGARKSVVLGGIYAAKL